MAVKTVSQKRRRNVILLLILIVAAVGAYAGITAYQKHQADLAKSKPFFTGLSADKITEITYKLADWDAVTLSQTDGTWKDNAYPDAPLLQANAAAMAQALAALTPSQKVDLAEGSISDYGFDSPSLTSQITAGSQSWTLTVGAKNTSGLGYYAQVSGDSSLYLIANDAYTSISTTEGGLMQVETVPQISSSSVLDYEWVEKGNTIVKVEEAKNADFDMPWLLTAPFAEVRPGYTVNLYTLFEYFNQIVFSSCVEYDAKDLSRYGLDDPQDKITMHYLDNGGKEYTFWIAFGNQDTTSDDEPYYVMTSQSNNVYYLNRTDTTNVLSGSDPFSYVYGALYYAGSTPVSITVTAGGKTTSVDPASDTGKAILDLSLDSAVTSTPASDPGAETLPADASHVGLITIKSAAKTYTYDFYDVGNSMLYRLSEDGGKTSSFFVTKKAVDAVL